MKVNEKLALSPGGATRKYRERIDRRRSIKAALAKTVEWKRKRLLRKKK